LDPWHYDGGTHPVPLSSGERCGG